MHKVLKLYSHLQHFGDKLQSPLLLTLRLIWGAYYVRSGWLKLFHFHHVLMIFQDWGIPYPIVSLALVMVTHLIGGLCLMVGFASRWVSIPLGFTMIVAYLTVHKEALYTVLNDPNNFVTEDPFLFLFTNVVIIAFGPGKFSLDHFFYHPKKVKQPSKKPLS